MSCPTWPDRTWHDLTCNVRSCHGIPHHVILCRDMSGDVISYGDITRMWHEWRRSVPTRDLTGSCAYRLKPSQDLETTRKFVSTCICSCSYVCILSRIKGSKRSALHKASRRRELLSRSKVVQVTTFSFLPHPPALRNDYKYLCGVCSFGQIPGSIPGVDSRALLVSNSSS